jgi:hypothetical protein
MADGRCEPWWDEVVATNDDAPPPLHFGDDPHGAYWSAERPPDAETDEPADYSVNGPVIRMMWDYGVRVPLWDAEGLLPEEPQWLRKALNLSEGLIHDLSEWGLDMNELDAAPRLRTKEAYEALDLRGRDLAQRLREEIGSRYRITYQPW